MPYDELIGLVEDVIVDLFLCQSGGSEGIFDQRQHALDREAEHIRPVHEDIVLPGVLRKPVAKTPSRKYQIVAARPVRVEAEPPFAIRPGGGGFQRRC